MSTPNRPHFPPSFDSTMLAAFRSCPHKMYRSYIEHWKPQTESVHLVAGGAFATGIEHARRAYYEGVYEDDGVEYADPAIRGNRQVAESLGLKALMQHYGDFECPPDSAKSLERTAGALEFYFAQYPFGLDGLEPLQFQNGRSAIEFSFAEPLEEILHPETGQPIFYTGRCDMIGTMAGGTYAVDEKTTSSLGASWARQWEMRAQFTGYQWAARRAGLPVQGTIVRGVSILKTKYDTQQAITTRSEYEVDRWYKQTIRDIRRALEMWHDGYWDFALDHACAEYGGCNMVRVCKSANPESWLSTEFTQRVWDPLARKERTLEEWEQVWFQR